VSDAVVPGAGTLAFYQSSGAFGFRDQLQDVMALFIRVPASLAVKSCAPPRANSKKRRAALVA